MTSLVYPSPDFPGPPSVRLEAPDGWEAAHAPGLALATKLVRPEGFDPNVVITIESVLAGHQVEVSLGQVRDAAIERGGAISEPYSADLGGMTFVGCDATWPDDDVETILQATLFAVLDAPHGGHVVQVTGAVGGATAEADYELIRGVITSVRVTPWTAAGSAAPE